MAHVKQIGRGNVAERGYAHITPPPAMVVYLYKPWLARKRASSPKDGAKPKDGDGSERMQLGKQVGLPSGGLARCPD